MSKMTANERCKCYFISYFVSLESYMTFLMWKSMWLVFPLQSRSLMSTLEDILYVHWQRRNRMQWVTSKELLWSWNFLCGFFQGHLKTEILKNGYRGADFLEFKRITILGLKRRPYVVVLNGRAIRGYASSYELSGVRAALSSYEKPQTKVSE